MNISTDMGCCCYYNIHKLKLLLQLNFPWLHVARLQGLSMLDICDCDRSYWSCGGHNKLGAEVAHAHAVLKAYVNWVWARNLPQNRLPSDPCAQLISELVLVPLLSADDVLTSSPSLLTLTSLWASSPQLRDPSSALRSSMVVTEALKSSQYPSSSELRLPSTLNLE